MPFPSGQVNHEGQPLLADQPSGQTHLVPTHDAKEHIVTASDVCWCVPQVQDEGGGYATVIHQPILPVVRGHTLAIKKLLIGVQNGVEFVVELPGR